MSDIIDSLTSILIDGAYLIAIVFGIWLELSIVTSAVKVFADDCSAHYFIESVKVSGNFFCGTNNN